MTDTAPHTRAMLQASLAHEGLTPIAKPVATLLDKLEDAALDQTIAATRRLTELLLLAKGAERPERKRLIADSHDAYARVVIGFCKLSEGTAR